MMSENSASVSGESARTVASDCEAKQSHTQPSCVRRAFIPSVRRFLFKRRPTYLDEGVALHVRVQLGEIVDHLLGPGLAEAVTFEEEVVAQVGTGHIVEIQNGELADTCVRERIVSRVVEGGKVRAGAERMGRSEG